MSEIVATLPQGTQVVVEAQLLTSDVDHTIEEVRQEVQQQQNGLPCGGGASRTSNRTLFCRKCEGHGQQVVLKGHASRCPYNNCQCKTCSNVMSMRANAIIRRYRTRTLEGGLVLKPVHFKNGNTRLRVFPKYVDESDALPIPMTQHQQILREKNASMDGIVLEQARAPIGVQHTTTTSSSNASPLPPPTPQQQQQAPPFVVKRSLSDELRPRHASISPEESPTMSAVQAAPPNIANNVPLSILDLLLRQHGLSPDLLNSGLILPSTQPAISTIPSTLYDGNFFAGLQFPTYSTPTTTFSSQIFPTNGFASTNENERKMSEAGLLGPTAMQLSELNIGVPEPTIGNDAAPKLTPNMFETSVTEEPEQPKPEPFTTNLMIAPNANRDHPLFRKFLNTVRELEKQMLIDNDS